MQDSSRPQRSASLPPMYGGKFARDDRFPGEVPKRWLERFSECSTVWRRREDAHLHQARPSTAASSARATPRGGNTHSGTRAKSASTPPARRKGHPGPPRPQEHQDEGSRMDHRGTRRARRQEGRVRVPAQPGTRWRTAACPDQRIADARSRTKTDFGDHGATQVKPCTCTTCSPASNRRQCSREYKPVVCSNGRRTPTRASPTAPRRRAARRRQPLRRCRRTGRRRSRRARAQRSRSRQVGRLHVLEQCEADAPARSAATQAEWPVPRIVPLMVRWLQHVSCERGMTGACTRKLAARTASPAAWTRRRRPPRPRRHHHHDPHHDTGAGLRCAHRPVPLVQGGANQGRLLRRQVVHARLRADIRVHKGRAEVWGRRRAPRPAERLQVL